MDEGLRLDRELAQGFNGFQADPGFQFRQQQGEDAINRSASARGGRLSGRTLQDLAQFNSGLASQEFQNFANRRAQQMALAGQADQSALGFAGQSDAQQNSLAANQAGREDAASMAQRQAQMNLANAGFGAQGQMANLAAQRGALMNQGFGGLANLAMQGAGQFNQVEQFTNNGLLQANQMRAGGAALPMQTAGAGSTAVGNAASNFMNNATQAFLMNQMMNGGGS